MTRTQKLTPKQARFVAEYLVDLNATHHAPVRSGWVTGEARAIRIGGTLGTWEVVLTDDAGERVCTARVTCALKRPKP